MPYESPRVHPRWLLSAKQYIGVGMDAAGSAARSDALFAGWTGSTDVPEMTRIGKWEGYLRPITFPFTQISWTDAPLSVWDRMLDRVLDWVDRLSART